jgi:hypothetical protein
MAYIDFNPINNTGGIAFGTGINQNVQGIPERMVINGSGNVGIGVTDPEYKLHVDGTVAIGKAIDYGEPILSLVTAHTNYLSIGFSQVDDTLLPPETTPNIENALNIQRTGNVGINVTSPTEKLEVNGTVKATNFRATGDITCDNLTVNGSTTTINTTNMQVTDNIISLNNGANAGQQNANDSGIIIQTTSTQDNIFMGWDMTDNKFKFGTTDSDSTTTGNITINTEAILKANLEGNVEASTITTTNNVSIGTTITSDIKLHVDGYTLIGPTNYHTSTDNSIDNPNVKLCVGSGRLSVRYDGNTVKDHIYLNNAVNDDNTETGILFRNWTLNGAIRFTHAGDFKIGVPDTAAILDQALTDTHLTIKYNGNVGIGTATPDAKLHIETNSATGIAGNAEHAETSVLHFSSIGVGGVINNVSGSIKLGSEVPNDGVFSNANPVGKMSFYLNEGGTNDNNWGMTPDTNVLTLLGNGNVNLNGNLGIGTNVFDNYKLHVNGNLKLSSSGNYSELNIQPEMNRRILINQHGNTGAITHNSDGHGQLIIRSQEHTDQYYNQILMHYSTGITLSNSNSSQGLNIDKKGAIILSNVNKNSLVIDKQIQELEIKDYNLTTINPCFDATSITNDSFIFNRTTKNIDSYIGGDNGIIIPKNKTLSFVNLPWSYTFDFWAKIKQQHISNGSISNMVFSQGSYQSGPWIIVGITVYADGTHKFVVQADNGSWVIQLPQIDKYNPHIWHHYTVIYTNLKGHLYLDGQLIYNNSINIGSGISSGEVPGLERFFIGHNFAGELKHLRIWNKERTNTEIQNANITSLYNALTIDSQNSIDSINEGFVFNGTDNYIEIPYLIAPELAYLSFTIEFWAKFVDEPITSIVYFQGELVNNAKLTIYKNSTYIILDIHGHSQHVALTELGTWKHYAVVFEYVQATGLGNARFYFNGIDQGNPTPYGWGSGQFINASGKVYIGKQFNGLHCMKGELKHLRVWNGVRTQSEISSAIAQQKFNALSINYSNTSNESFIFNGTDNSFEIPSNIAPQFADVPFTIDFWAKIFKVGNSSVYCQGPGSFTGSLLYIYISNNTPPNDKKITVNLWGRSQYVILPSSSSLNTWNHYAVVFDGTNCSFYFNGNNIPLLPGNIYEWDNSINATGAAFIGKNHTSGTDYIEGELKHLRVYNDIRTQGEIQNAISGLILNNELTINYSNTSNDSFIFDGIDNYFEISANIAPQLGGSDFTIEFWTKLNATATEELIYPILSIGTDEQATGESLTVGFHINNGVTSFYVSIRHYWGAYVDVTSIANSYNHYCFTYNSSNGTELFINGVSEQTRTGFKSNGPPYSYAEPHTNINNKEILIGKSESDDYDTGNGLPTYFIGEIKHLRIWNSIMPNIYNYSTTEPVDNLSLYMPMNSNDKNIYKLNYNINYINDYSTTLSDNLLLYIPMNSNDKNIYEISNATTDDEVNVELNNYSTILSDNLLLYIPMIYEDKNIYKILYEPNLSDYSTSATSLLMYIPMNLNNKNIYLSNFDVMKTSSNTNVAIGGIGTATPDAKLHIATNSATGIAGDAEHAETSVLHFSSIGVGGVINNVSGSIKLGSEVPDGTVFSNANPVGKMSFYLNEGGTNDNSWGGTPDRNVLTLLGNGNIGTGTDNPIEKLHINNGNLLITQSKLQIENFSISNKLNESFSFNGIDNDIKISENIAPRLYHQSFTIEFWAKINDNSSKNIVYAQGQDTTGANISIYIQDNSIYLDFYEIYATATIYDYSLWHHYTIIYDTEQNSNHSTATKFYQDGILLTNDSSSSNDSSNPVATGRILIGKDSGDIYRLKGELKHLRVWNGIRTESEIKQAIKSYVPSHNINLLLEIDTIGADGNINIFSDITNNNSIARSSFVVHTNSVTMLSSSTLYFNDNHLIITENIPNILDIGTSSFTIEFWAKMMATANSEQWKVFFQFGNHADVDINYACSIGLWYNDSTLNLHIGNTGSSRIGGYKTYNVSILPWANSTNWSRFYHIAIVRNVNDINDKSVQLYIDGKKIQHTHKYGTLDNNTVHNIQFKSPRSFLIGDFINNTGILYGYIESFKFIKDAIYTEDFNIINPNLNDYSTLLPLENNLLLYIPMNLYDDNIYYEQQNVMITDIKNNYVVIGKIDTIGADDNIKLSLYDGRFNVRYDSPTVKDHIYLNNADASGNGETGIIFRNNTKNMAMRMNYNGDFKFGAPPSNEILDASIGDGFLTIKYNGNVGIGSPTPNEKLEVNGGRFALRYDGVDIKDHIYLNNGFLDNNTETGILFRNHTSNGVIRFNNAGDFKIGIPSFPDSDDGTGILGGVILDPHLTIKFNGNVGIGIFEPSEHLSITGSNTGSIISLGLRNGRGSDDTVNDGAQIAFGYNNTNDYQHFIHTRHKAGTNLDNGNAIDFYTCDGTQNNSVTSGSIHTMSIVSGKVGIGTDDPDEKLEVNGKVKATHFIGDGSSLTNISVSGLTSSQWTTGSSLIYYNGKVVVGSTSTLNYAYMEIRNHISADKPGYFHYLRNVNGSSVGDGSNGSSNYSLYCEKDVRCGGEYHVTSDRRIKKNILELEDGEVLIKFRQLKPCKYNYIDENRGTTEVYGFIAQEVKEILTYAVNSESTEFIPNIYKGALYNNNIITFTETHNLDSNGNIKLILSNNEDITVPYTIIDTYKINIDLTNIADEEKPSNDLVQDEDGNDLPNNIFVYGTKVDDFHLLNKNAIWTTAAAALQEVDKIQQSNITKISNLESELQLEKNKVSTLETEVYTLKTQLQDVLTRLSALENN